MPVSTESSYWPTCLDFKDSFALLMVIPLAEFCMITENIKLGFLASVCSSFDPRKLNALKCHVTHFYFTCLEARKDPTWRPKWLANIFKTFNKISALPGSGWYADHWCFALPYPDSDTRQESRDHLEVRTSQGHECNSTSGKEVPPHMAHSAVGLLSLLWGR